MTRPITTGYFADAILSADDEMPIAVWTLDELEHDADLDSIRIALSRADDPGLLHAR